MVDAVSRVQIDYVVTGLDTTLANMDRIAQAEARLVRQSQALAGETALLDRSTLSAGRSLDAFSRGLDPAAKYLAQYERGLSLANRATAQGIPLTDANTRALAAAKARYDDVAKGATDSARAHGAHGAAVKLNGAQLAEFGHIGRAAFDEWGAGAGPLMILRTEGARLVQAFSEGSGGVTGTFKALGSGIADTAEKAASFIGPWSMAGAAVVGFGAAALIALDRARSLREEMDRAVSGAGRYAGLSGAGLASLAATSAASNGLSLSDSRAGAMSLAGTGKLDASNISGALGQVRGYAGAFNVDYGTAGQQLADIYSDPTKGADKLNERLGFLDDRTRQYIRTLQAEGNQQGAVKALLDATSASMNEQVKPQGFFDRANAALARQNAEIERQLSGPTAIERYQHDALYGGRPGGTVDISSEAEDIRRSGQLRKMQQDDVANGRLSIDAGNAIGAINPDAGRYRDLQAQQKLLSDTMANSDATSRISPGLDSSGRLVSGADLLADSLGKVNDRLANFMSSTERQTLSINAQVLSINAWTLGEKLAAATATEMASLGIRQIKTADELLAVQSKQTEIIAQANDKAYNLNRDAGDRLALSGLTGLDRTRAEINQKYSNYRDQLSDLSGGSDLEGIGPTFLKSRTAVISFSDALDLATKRLASFPGGSVDNPPISPDDHPLTIRPRAGSLSPGFQSSLNRTLGFEGGLNPRDTNGTPSNMGINAAAHPGVDVANLTQSGAASIYKSQYWDKIGADSMSPQMARVSFDTAVTEGVGKALKLIAASGGDASKLMDLREGFESSLLKRDPAKYGPYRQAWSDRDAGLRADIGSVSATSGVLGVKLTTPSDLNSGNRRELASANNELGTGIVASATGSLDQKIDAFDRLTKSVGMSNVQLARYNEVMTLQNQLDRAKVQVTPEMTKQIGALGDQAAELARRQDELNKRTGALDSVRGVSNDALGSVAHAIASHQSVGTALRGVGERLGSNLINTGVGGITSGLFGKTGSPGGGLFGDAIGGLFGGGSKVGSATITAGSVTVIGGAGGGLPGAGGAGGGGLLGLFGNLFGSPLGGGGALGIGHNAAGTDDWKGGPTWIDEKGPEIVNLPAHAQIVPNGAAFGQRAAAPTINMGDTHVHVAGDVSEKNIGMIQQAMAQTKAEMKADLERNLHHYTAANQQAA